MPKLLDETRWSFKYEKCLVCGRNDRKHKANGYCKPCYNKTDFSKEKRNKWMKEYRKTHPQKWYGTIRRGYKYSQATNPKINKCEICGKEDKTVFDHNHITGKFRGWLCMHCNVMLGMIKDNIETLNKMINYLIKNS